jgi:hypothetical protein
MLRNVQIHIVNEQPLMVDLLVEPAATDACLVCRNMRTMSGKKPAFVDQVDSTFLLPVANIRFVEIPAASYAEDAADRAAEEAARPSTRATARAGGGDPGRGRPEPARAQVRAQTEIAGPATPDGPSASELSDAADAIEAAVWGEPSNGDDAEAHAGEGLDDDLLRRIREA